MGGGLNVIKTKNEFLGINLIKDTQKNYKIVLRKQKQISKNGEIRPILERLVCPRLIQRVGDGIPVAAQQECV